MTTSTRPQEAMLPQNLEAEQGVLGSLIIDNQAYAKVAAIVKAEDFYGDTHKVIFEALAELAADGIPGDFIALSDRLSSQGKLEQVGDASYLVTLINSVPTSSNAVHYAEIVQRQSILRNLIQAAGQIAALGYEDGDAQEALNEAQRLLLVLAKRATSQEVNKVGGVIGDYMNEIDRLSQHPDELIGVPTGIKDIDNMLSGLRKTFLYLLAARPAIGKSSLALNVALNAAKAGYNVLFLSVEMAVTQLINKLVSQESAIDSNRLQRGKLYDDEWEPFTTACHTLQPLPLWVGYLPALTIPIIRMHAQTMMQEDGLDLIIVDYLQLMEGGNKRNDSRTNEVGEISRGLKKLAGELDVPVLALAQLNREVEKRASKIPQLSDLRDSGTLEQDSDVVSFLYRDDVYNPETERPNTADFIVSKNRHGPVGTVSMFFKKDTTTFHGLEVHGEEPVYDKPYADNDYQERPDIQADPPSNITRLFGGNDDDQ